MLVLWDAKGNLRGLASNVVAATRSGDRIFYVILQDGRATLKSVPIERLIAQAGEMVSPGWMEICLLKISMEQK